MDFYSTDFYSTELSPVFHTKIRKCYHCKEVCNIVKICSRCKVFAYCSQDCQLKSWKKNHKQICKPINPKTIREQQSWANAWTKPDGLFCYLKTLPNSGNLDSLYKYILLAPTRDPDCNVQGIDDDDKLDTYFTASANDDDDDDDDEYHNKLIEAKDYIQEKYNWSTTIERVSVPGFGASEYNGYVLMCYMDDNCKNSAEPINPAGDFYFHTQPNGKKLRGNLILVAYTDIYMTEIVPISRRDVIWYADHLYKCGAIGCVSERTHFCNMQRSEVASFLSQSNFINLNLS